MCSALEANEKASEATALGDASAWH
jgi:hypothetical protein